MMHHSFVDATTRQLSWLDIIFEPFRHHPILTLIPPPNNTIFSDHQIPVFEHTNIIRLTKLVLILFLL